MSKAGDRARDGGATLLEMLVVVALTALTASIVFPRIERSFASMSLHETSAMLLADLRIARASALRGGAPIVFSVAEDGHTYGWTGGMTRTTSAAVALTSAGSTITFYADGSASGGALALVAGLRRVAIAVDPATGAVGLGAQ